MTEAGETTIKIRVLSFRFEAGAGRGVQETNLKTISVKCSERGSLKLSIKLEFVLHQNSGIVTQYHV